MQFKLTATNSKPGIKIPGTKSSANPGTKIPGTIGLLNESILLRADRW